MIDLADPKTDIEELYHEFKNHHLRNPNTFHKYDVMHFLRSKESRSYDDGDYLKLIFIWKESSLIRTFKGDCYLFND
jgi:hypothetical protein